MYAKESYETRLREGGVVVPCGIVVEGIRLQQYFVHNGRHHFGDNVCVLPPDDAAKAAARARLEALIMREATMTDVSEANEATTWADMTEWHRVQDPIGPDYMERVDRSALEGQTVDLSAVPRFRVIRETWDETTDPPTRVIHELEVAT